MSKRKPGLFTRVERDFYPTTYAQAARLLPHLEPGTRFYEPCAGAGDLVRHLTANGHVCVRATDVKPRDQSIGTLDALILCAMDVRHADMIITNPPHRADDMVAIIENLRKLKPTWVLIPIDRLVVDYMQKLLCFARTITPSRRLQLEGTKHQGHDNYVWVRFEATMQHSTEFLPAL